MLEFKEKALQKLIRLFINSVTFLEVGKIEARKLDIQFKDPFEWTGAIKSSEMNMKIVINWNEGMIDGSGRKK